MTKLEEIIDGIKKAQMNVSGGLTYFSADAKHAQLQDADKNLVLVLAMLEELQAEMKND